MNETIQTAAAELRRHSSDILKIRFRPGIGIEAEHADEIVSSASRVFGGSLHANLVDVRELMFMSQSARDRFAKQKPLEVAGIAVIVDSALQKTMANLYLSVSRPTIPTKLFTSEAPALQWLKEQNDGRRSSLPAPP